MLRNREGLNNNCVIGIEKGGHCLAPFFIKVFAELLGYSGLIADIHRVIQTKTKMETQILSTENIKATEFTDEANILTLSSEPTVEEQRGFFKDDASVVLEF